MSAALALLLCVAAADAPVAPAAAPKPWSMAVLELTGQGVPVELAKLVSEALLQEAHKLEGPRVIGMVEVRALLGFEQQRQLVGCTESECLTEMVGALGVDKVLSGSIGKLGDSWLLHLRVSNFHTSRTEAQVSERIVGGRGEEFLDAVGPVIERLFPGVPLRAGQVRGAGPTLRARASSLRPGVSRKWAYGTGGAAVALLAVGVGFGLSSRGAAGGFDQLNSKAATQPVPVEQVTAAYDRAKRHATYANVFLGVGSATALAAVLLFAFLEPEPSVNPAVPALGAPPPVAGAGRLLILPTAQGLALAGRF